jgi:hypothetical protein
MMSGLCESGDTAEDAAFPRKRRVEAQGDLAGLWHGGKLSQITP